MIYNLAVDFDRERFKKRVNALFAKKVMVELQDISRRTYKQNSYLHLIVSYFASQIGEKADVVKQVIYKQIVNKDMFVRYRDDIPYLRSVKDLTSDEMNMSITRFKSYCSENGVYIPDEGEESVVLFIVHRILDLRVIKRQFAPRLYEAVLKPQHSKPLRF